MYTDSESTFPSNTQRPRENINQPHMGVAYVVHYNVSGNASQNNKSIYCMNTSIIFFFVFGTRDMYSVYMYLSWRYVHVRVYIKP